jgi:predicted porin
MKNFKLRASILALAGVAMLSLHGMAQADGSTGPTDIINNFMEADAPFKTEFLIDGHLADFQVYGVIDVGAAYTNHSYPSNSELPNNLYPLQNYNAQFANSQTSWINGGLQDSRLGFKGGIDLFQAAANNVRFIYQLEIGFNPMNGTLNNAAKTLAVNSGTAAQKATTVSADSSLNGELFGRQAWAGIDAGQIGQFTAGLQYNPFYNIFGQYDPTNKADTFSPFGESGTYGGGGGVSENSRMKNSIKYANGINVMDGKLTGSAIYQFGNASDDVSKGYGFGLQAGYETSLFGVQFAYDKFTDAPAAGVSGTPGDISATFYNTKGTLLALKLTPNKEWKFKGGWEWFQRSNPSDTTGLNYGDLWGYAIAPGGTTYGFGPARGGASQDYNIFFAGTEYNFGERFPVLKGLSLAVGYYDILKEDKEFNDGTNGGGNGREGVWTQSLIMESISALTFTLRQRQITFPDL